MRILSVVGARPQFIKAAPMSRVLRQNHDEFLVHTGQHYDDRMSQVFLDQLGISVELNLNVGSGSHAEHMAAMIVPLEKAMLENKPDWVLVYGDTNSTLAGALAAAKLNIPVAHVEAGLRSFNRTMPEEINRVLTDHVSALLFCSTQAAVDNLADEGVTDGVVITGDIMVDTLMMYVDKARATSTVLQDIGLSDTDFGIVTIHRPANADSPQNLTEIVKAFNALPFPVVFPVHPRTRKNLEALDIQPASHVHLIEPVSYLDMLALLDAAQVAITDSGGLQKEAYVLRTPCVTVRPETEWVETVESGWNCLVAPEQDAMVTAITTMARGVQRDHPDYYGDGQAAQRMVRALETYTE